MKDSYPDWLSLKKDAALEKAEDISRDRDSALVTINKTTVLSYKKQGDSWIKIK